MATIEIVPPPDRAFELQEDLDEIADELERLGHDAYRKSEKRAIHEEIAWTIIRIVEHSIDLARLLEQIRDVLRRARRRREADGKPNEVVKVYGPNGDVLLEVEI